MRTGWPATRGMRGELSWVGRSRPPLPLALTVLNSQVVSRSRFRPKLSMAGLVSLRVSVTVRPGITYNPVRYSLLPLVGRATSRLRETAGTVAGISGAKLPRFCATALEGRCT